MTKNTFEQELGIGVDNIHFNQGSQEHHKGSNGIYQDGAIFIKNKKSYTAVFICFVGQCNKPI